MRFLLRMAFWLSLVVLLLPTGKSAPGTEQPSAADAVSAAEATVADVRGFCDRRPEACSVGAQAARAFGYKAQAGAKMIYDFLSEKLGPTETGSVDGILKPDAGAAKSQDTLTPTDLKPEWRGAAPRKEAQARRPAA